MRLHTSILAVLLLAIAALAAVSLAPDMPVNASLHGLASTLIKTHTPTSTPLPEATATATATHTATPEPTATATPSATVTPSATPTQAPVSSRAIFVDQDAQVMHVYENGVEIKTIPCSTGTGEPGESTPPWSGRVGHYVGTFFAFGSFADDAWFLFKSAGDILIHSAPYVWEDGKKVYQDMDALGTRPASHGCIRLAPEDARWLTRWNPRGVPITISARTKGPS